MSTRPDRSAGTGRAPETSGPRGTVGAARSRFSTPWGDGEVTVIGGRLTSVELPPVSRREEGADAMGAAAATTAVPPNATDEATAERWVAELEAYFKGDKLAWEGRDIGLGDLPAGTFTRRVYETLLTVPPGATVSYGDLAALAGYPRAARAVGTAMATNPIPIVVPCHRVIRSDGSLGRYGDDPRMKAELLEHERRHSGEGGGADGRHGR